MKGEWHSRERKPGEPRFGAVKHGDKKFGSVRAWWKKSCKDKTVSGCKALLQS